MNAQRDCPFCKRSVAARLAQFVAINKAIHVGWQCLTCNNHVPDRKSRIWIPHDELLAHAQDPELLPVARDLSVEVRCSRCGCRGAELHHWAPRHLFGDDADKWPKDYLCKSCHDEWHDLVTPGVCTP